jgi:hypothetical protein
MHSSFTWEQVNEDLENILGPMVRVVKLDYLPVTLNALSHPNGASEEFTLAVIREIVNMPSNVWLSITSINEYGSLLISMQVFQIRKLFLDLNDVSMRMSKDSICKAASIYAEFAKLRMT